MMVILKLKRFKGTSSLTQGELTEDTTGLKLVTLEQAHPDYVGGILNTLALPDGLYKVKRTMMLNAWELKVSKPGTYRRATIEGGEKVSKVAGVITCGMSVEGFRLKGGEEAEKALQHMVSQLMGMGVLSFKGEARDILLDIKTAPNFEFVNTGDKMVGEDDGIDWEEEDEDDYS